MALKLDFSKNWLTCVNKNYLTLAFKRNLVLYNFWSRVLQFSIISINIFGDLSKFKNFFRNLLKMAFCFVFDIFSQAKKLKSCVRFYFNTKLLDLKANGINILNPKIFTKDYIAISEFVSAKLRRLEQRLKRLI